MTQARPIPLHLLKLAIAICFLCHGIIAWQSSTVFYSEWSVWIQRLLPSAPFSGATYFLRTVGSLDCCAALLLLLPRFPQAILVWLIGWGFATACSRLYFLSSLDSVSWMNQGLPLAEFLLRTANWLLPVIVLRRVHPLPERWSRGTDQQLIQLAMVATTIGAFLHYIVDYASPLYPQEVVLQGEPLWIFHGLGLTLAASLVTIFLARMKYVSATTAAVLVAFALGAGEAVDVAIKLAPQGVLFTALRLGEYAPVAVCLALISTGQRIKGQHRGAV